MAKEIWDAVAETYSDVWNLAQFEIETQIREIKQESQSVSKISAYWELDEYYDAEWECVNDSVQ